MLEEARGWREAAERESRAEPQASRFAKAARRDASMREGLDPAERAEELRARWLLGRLSRRGRRRAMTEGWPDTYALSKALGERLLARTLGEDDDRAADDHRVGAAAAAPRLAGGHQGRRPADPRLRGARPHPPARPRLEPDRHRPRRPRRPRLRRRRRPPAGGAAAHDRDRQQRPQPAGDRRARRPHPRILPPQPAAGRGGRPIEIGELQFVDRRDGAAQDGPPRAALPRAWRGWRSPRRSASPRSACCAATARRWPNG